MIIYKASEIAEKVNRNKTVNIEANAAGRMYSGAHVHQGRMYSRNIIHQVPNEGPNTNSKQGQGTHSAWTVMYSDNITHPVPSASRVK